MERPIKMYLAWLPAIAVAVAIFLFSHQPSEESTVMSESIIEIIIKIASEVRAIDPKTMNLRELYFSFGTPVRKTAHIFEFSVLDAALLYALHVWGMRGLSWVRRASFLAFLYACSDEFHQLFVPGRAGLFTDVLIDMIGVFLIGALLSCINAHRCAKQMPVSNKFNHSDA